MKRNPNCVCKECSKPIYRRPSQLEKGDVFCGTTCANIRNKKTHNCPVCGVEVLTRKNSLTCSRKCSNIHRTGTSYKIGRPRDKATTIRTIKNQLIAERGSCCNRCGFDDIRILQIHHIIEQCNGGSDDPENLEVLCPNCHTLHHYLNKTNLDV